MMIVLPVMDLADLSAAVGLCVRARVLSWGVRIYFIGTELSKF